MYKKYMVKKTIWITILSIICACIIISWDNYLILIKTLHWKVYDQLTVLDYHLSPPPEKINDIVLVYIDNETLYNLTQRWPYPRSYFAKVITNLTNAQPKAIGLDFLFFGNSNETDDKLLEIALTNNKKIVLATSLNENNELQFFNSTDLHKGALSGIITKIIDPKGVTRSSLTFMTRENNQQDAFLSWDIQLLSIIKTINLSSFICENNNIAFKNYTGEKWKIPVSNNDKTFLIHYRARSNDFKYLSFYRILNGDFDPNIIKDKIVLVGLASSLFTDIHHTPLGVMPGITLNANSFLTLYSQDFLRKLPAYIDWIAIILGVIISSLFMSLLKTKSAIICIIEETAIFYLISYVLFKNGLIWNYGTIFCAILISSLFANGLYKLFYYAIIKHPRKMGWLFN